MLDLGDRTRTGISILTSAADFTLCAYLNVNVHLYVDSKPQSVGKYEERG